MVINRFVRLDRQPVGAPSAELFSLHSEGMPELAKGQYLIKNQYIAMDPALVGRLRAENNYADQVEPGSVMHAYCVGRVMASRNERFELGQMLYGQFDMQQYKLADDTTLSIPVDDGVDPSSLYLGVLGTTGATAYFALQELCEPKAGECIVVSSAASSVGATAGQLAKRAGCRTVGIVSSQAKADHVKSAYGYDDVVCYRGKTVQELSEALSAVCPSGIDMYFDNTSGDISEALLDLYNDHARIAVVGRMGLSHLENTCQDSGRRDNSVILSKRIKKQGFVVLDYLHRMSEALSCLKELVQAGELTVEEDIMEGIDNAPKAFMRMIKGENLGKQLVKI
ncbi:NADP-dependent oxidoreductase [Pseudomaricurvus alkylphenolicus]|uniref:NADP-dependent oxidoreductase n=1 Tax=Pseudomaricurvus alkylphenolicus TaxID=1306991 RepID=UPI00141D9A35|nr:NADP-dependent oxidoreductase [Pseudomaricurvus alkylphenolicus]NIB43532.1 NADP-dependent oxidoreductase [Pseudomaricurvus alkylphenolicus]